MWWDLLGKVSNILQLLSVFPFLLTAYLFWRRSGKYKKLMKEQEGTKSENPKAMAIGLIGTGDISGQVANFIKDSKFKMDIVPYFTEVGKGVTKENLHEILRDLLKIKSRLTDQGVTELHLFIAAPVAITAAIGALLDNWVPVKVYQPKKTGGYEFWTILHKGYVPGLEDSSIKSMIEAEL